MTEEEKKQLELFTLMYSTFTDRVQAEIITLLKQSEKYNEEVKEFNYINLN